MINRAGAEAWLGHIHPHQLRHTLPPRRSTGGMSLEAIAAMLGHRSLDMTLRYPKIACRTVADEYFAVAEKVEARYGHAPVLPGDAIGPKHLTAVARGDQAFLVPGLVPVVGILDEVQHCDQNKDCA